MAKEPYFPFFTGDWIQATRHLSLAARGAWIDLLSFMWNAQNRGTIVETIEGYARRFGASVEQTTRVICELTTHECGVAGVEMMLNSEKDGVLQFTESECSAFIESGNIPKNAKIRIISRRMVRDNELRETRKRAGAKGGASTSILLKQNGQQNSSKTLDMDMDMVLGINRGGVGETPTIAVADVPHDAGPDDAEWAEWDTEMRVRYWLNKWPRFPLVNTSPKDVSSVAAMTDKWGWDFVKECLTVALDKGAKRPVPYAETVAERRSAERFADGEKAAAKANRRYRA